MGVGGCDAGLQDCEQSPVCIDGETQPSTLLPGIRQADSTIARHGSSQCVSHSDRRREWR